MRTKELSSTIIPAAPGWFTVFGDVDTPDAYVGEAVIAWKIDVTNPGEYERVRTTGITSCGVDSLLVLGYLRPDGKIEASDAIFENLDDVRLDRIALFNAGEKA